MIEPTLLFESTDTVGEISATLAQFSAIRYITIHDETLQNKDIWFVVPVDQLEWLLEEREEAETLSAALQLDQINPAPIYIGPASGVPDDFEGVIVDGTTVLGIAYSADFDPFNTVRSGEIVESDALAPIISEEGEEAVKGLESQLPTSNSATVDLFFATDRAPVSSQKKLFGGERGELQFGKIEVTLPPNHRRGEVESPKWWRLEFRADPKRHITLHHVEMLPEEQFAGAINAQFEAGNAASEILVFVHGYNTGFVDGVRRTAQIAHDLRFGGVPILYSWPSANSLIRYTVDENNARWTEPHFIRFLELLLKQTAAESIHVIAHSMGNRVVTESLRTLPADLDTGKLNQVLLAAPDIDADVFETIAAAVKARAKGCTLYASSRDLALRASKLVHGNPRAGDSEPELVIVDTVDTIDATSAETDLLGHGYIGDSSSILADMRELLQTGLPARERPFFLTQQNQQGKPYWEFTP